MLIFRHVRFQVAARFETKAERVLFGKRKISPPMKRQALKIFVAAQFLACPFVMDFGHAAGVRKGEIVLRVNAGVHAHAGDEVVMFENHLVFFFNGCVRLQLAVHRF